MYTNTLDLSSKTDKQITPETQFTEALDSIIEISRLEKSNQLKDKIKMYSLNPIANLNSIFSIITDDNSDLTADSLQLVLDSYHNYLSVIYDFLYKYKGTLNELICSDFYPDDTTEQLQSDYNSLDWFLNNLSYQIPVSFNSLIQLSQILTF